MLTRQRILVAASAAALAIGLTTGAGATPLLTNLIVNSGAEANTGASDFNSTVVPTGWSVGFAGASAVQYAIGTATDLNTADSTAIGGGANYFAGGPNVAASSLIQVINIADLAVSIDANFIQADLSAYLGGYDTQGDSAAVLFQFLDAASTVLGATALPAVTAAERGNVSQLLLRSADDVVVPIGTRQIRIELDFVRTAGNYNDGYADNLSLSLQSSEVTDVPEPATLALFGAALLGLGVMRRRTRRTA